MNKVISKILSANSLEQLNSIIQNRIDEEKQEYLNFASKNSDCKNFSGARSFITPPNDAYDTSVHSLETFLHPELTEIFISTYPAYSYTFDDENEIYQLFANELSKLKNPNDLKQVMTAVSETIFTYIGGAKVKGDDFTRLSMLKPASWLDENEKNKISVFKNSGNAWCVERAAIAQQLFKFIGLDSKMIMTTISNNSEHQIHAFNLVKANEKTILFDSAVMTHPQENEKYNPVAFILPEDVFSKTLVGTEPLPERDVIGESGRHYRIIYDLENRKVYENTSSKEFFSLK